MIHSNFYYELLFDEDDYVCSGDKYSNKVHHNTERESCEYITVNAMKKGTTRSDVNVVKYRNLLVEIDDVSIAQQKAFINQVGLPYSVAVFSGGKSIHFIISLFHLLPDEETYRALWCGVQQVFKQVGCNIDNKCKNPSRFTRVPGGYRPDKKANQLLLKVNERVPNHELFAWLRRNGVDGIDQFRPKPPTPSTITHTTANDDERFSHAQRLMGNDSFTSGNRDSYRYKLAIRCKQVGFSESDAKSLIDNLCGVSGSKNDPVSNAFKKSVEHINVLSKKDYKAQKAKEKKQLYIDKYKLNNSDYGTI